MPERILSWLDANWFALLVLVVLVGMMLYGHSVGFLRLSVNVAAGLITLALTRLAVGPVTTVLTERTGIQRTLRQMVVHRLGLDTLNLEEAGSLPTQTQLIEELPLSPEMKEELLRNNNQEMWERLGVDRFSSYVADSVSRIVIHAVLFILIFIVIWLLLRLLLQVLDVITRIPVIHGLNQIAGAVLGLVEGLLLVWTAFLVIGWVLDGDSRIMVLIRTNLWLRFLYHYNLVGWLLNRLLLSIL